MLPLSALDLNRGWINFPRPKTAIDRRVPLWPETVAALREAIAARPAVKDSDAEALVFVTSRGRPWLSNGIANPVSVATRALMKQVGIHRPGIGHYTLRHVFRTTADEAGDQVAANAIMGHVDASMANAYREKIADERLQKVVNYVRAWLFNEGVK
jgi:integrase